LQSVPKIALTNLASFQAVENKADSFQGLPNKGDMVSWVEKHNPAAGGFCLFYFRLYKVCQANERVCACRGRLPGVVLIRTLYSNKSLCNQLQNWLDALKLETERLGANVSFAQSVPH
jgi:hypothetical protein